MVFFAYFLIVILSTIVIQQLKYSKPSLFLCGPPHPPQHPYLGNEESYQSWWKTTRFPVPFNFHFEKNQKNFQFSSLSSPISLNLLQLSIESQGPWRKVAKCRSRRQELDATFQLCSVDIRFSTLQCAIVSMVCWQLRVRGDKNLMQLCCVDIGTLQWGHHYIGM